MSFFGRLFGSGQKAEKLSPSPTNQDPVWHTLKFLLRNNTSISSDFTTEQKVELLARLVANLIDEVTLLRHGVLDQRLASAKQDDSSRSWEKLNKEFDGGRIQLLFSGATGIPEPLRKYIPFLRSEQEWAKVLIPDEAERNEIIAGLQAQT